MNLIIDEYGIIKIPHHKCALGIEECNENIKPSTICVIFPVIENDLHKFNERELNYILKEILKI